MDDFFAKCDALVQQYQENKKKHERESRELLRPSYGIARNNISSSRNSNSNTNYEDDNIITQNPKVKLICYNTVKVKES